MTLEKRDDLRFSLFAIAVLVAACVTVALVFSIRPPDESSWAYAPVFGVLLAAVLISEVQLVMVPGGGSMSLSYPLFVAASIYLGPLYAAVISIASILPLFLSRPMPRWDRFVFNSGQIALTAMAPGLVYWALGGRLLAGLPRHHDALEFALPLVAAAAIGVGVNFFLSGLGLKILTGESMRRIWIDTFMWVLPSQLLLGLVGVAMAETTRAIGLLGFVLFIVPLIVARQTYEQSVTLRDAYSDTVSSLVAALEAKDQYTKGHSLRVAEYAVQICTRMGLSHSTIDRVERAALLHDIGKVGVSHQVLSKDSALSEEEYAEIKRHPDIGAHILADVPHLADLVFIIASHHEKIDGTGYGKGLRADDIPVESRVLAVADAYDAMTSERPYRAPMSHESAIEQLRRGSGTQFDPSVVEAFEESSFAPADLSEVRLQTPGASSEA